MGYPFLFPIRWHPIKEQQTKNAKTKQKNVNTFYKIVFKGCAVSIQKDQRQIILGMCTYYWL